MFYEQNQFDSVLECPVCMHRYDVPLMVPCCWKTICQKCAEKMNTNGCCVLCQAHTNKSASSNGQIKLPVNEALSKLLELKPVDLINTDFYRKISDLYKSINLNLDELTRIENCTETNIVDYFALLKSEISNNVENLIQKALDIKKSIQNELDCIETSFLTYLEHLNLSYLKSIIKEKLKNWQVNLNDASFDQLDQLLKDCELLNQDLSEKINFINQYLLNINKIVFNQKNEINSLLESYIGRLDFEFADHSLLLPFTVKYLNNLVKKEVINIDLNVKLIYTGPVGYKKILFVSKNDFDEFTDVKLHVCDLSNRLLYQQNELKMKINYVQTSLKYVCVSLTDYQTGRNMLKLFTDKLSLVKSVILDDKASFLYLNNDFVYAKMSTVYPFLHKFDYNLEKQPVFNCEAKGLNARSDLLACLNLESILAVENSRIYLLDEYFSCINVYSEQSGEFLEKIRLRNCANCFVKLSFGTQNEENNEERVVCVDRENKTLGIYGKNKKLIVENRLESSVKNVDSFFLCHDGSLMLTDNLNDFIYYYSV
ncbi:hypothetical protein BpHYR1_040187 [Brachionus plicatilis]|uniref:RING-type domain-containing protein n=1 Tax=Brachionus plicatilis TaxID=10195 RepID=A0A3M7PWQ5_BRAPC|nr:hypothetical protein BpHYR1_040187 [Brachionus plicatilis]